MQTLCVAGQLYSIVSSLSNEHILSAGFDINTPDSLGRTCLHAAASGGYDITTLNYSVYCNKSEKYIKTPDNLLCLAEMWNV